MSLWGCLFLGHHRPDTLSQQWTSGYHSVMKEDDYKSPSMALQQGWLLELDCAVQHHIVDPCFWDEMTISPDDEESKWQHQIIGCDQHGPPDQRMDNLLGQGHHAQTHLMPCCDHFLSESPEEAEHVQKYGHRTLKPSPPVQTRSILRPSWESCTYKFPMAIRHNVL